MCVRSGSLDQLESSYGAKDSSLGGPPTMMMIVGPASRYFPACPRNFNSQAALPMSPLAADAASRLTLNSRRDAFFTLPRSLNSVVAFNTLFMISPICRSPPLPRPRGLGSACELPLQKGEARTRQRTSRTSEPRRGPTSARTGDPIRLSRMLNLLQEPNVVFGQAVRS